MKVIKVASRLDILLILAALSIAATILQSGATLTASAQQSTVDFGLPNLAQIPEIPETFQSEDLIPCLPPPECLLPGAEVCIRVCWPFAEEITE
jgi:hypothetical protein